MKIPEFLEGITRAKSLHNLSLTQELEFLYLEYGIVTNLPKSNGPCFYYIFLTSLLDNLKNSGTYLPLDEIDFIHLHCLQWKDLCLIRFNSGNFTIVGFTGCGCLGCLSDGSIPPERLNILHLSSSKVDKFNYPLTIDDRQLFLSHYNQSISTYQFENRVQFLE